MSGYTVKTRTLALATSDGADTRAFVAEPDAPGPHPAIVFGCEALGLNDFGRGMATDVSPRYLAPRQGAEVEA
jgi:dienelactone hydrolase